MRHFDESNDTLSPLDLHTSAAMLISVFGQPEHAAAQVSSYQWRLVHADGSHARIYSLLTGELSAAAVQPWRVDGSSAAALEQVRSAMQAGENYYDGALHPELFIQRDK